MPDSGDTQHFTKNSLLSRLGLSIRGIVVIVGVVSVCLIQFGGLKVDEPLYSLVTVMVGYYFGQQHGQDKK